MRIDNKLLELIETHFKSDTLHEFGDIYYSTLRDIQNYVKSKNYASQTEFIHRCLYFNLQEEEYEWAQECKVEIGKL